MTDGMTIGCEARDSYVDGELTALENAAFDRHVSGCSTCQREIERMLRLRADLRDGLTRFVASDDLLDRIRAALPDQAPRRRDQRHSGWRGWQSMAAAAAVAAILASSATFTVMQPASRETWTDAALRSHLRATMSGHVFDVASSDRHTVKPWFGGKTAVAPIVVDLSAAGYPLLGGRLDIPEREPLPVLVYQAGPHIVSVFVRSESAAAAPSLRREAGFSILIWRERELEFTAVSDADAAELKAFQNAFSTELAKVP